jgi:hypothetical protein
MNNNYVKILDKLSFTILDLKKSIDNTPHKVNEDQKIHILLDDLLDKLDYTTNLIMYFNQTAITGVLKELPNGRFEIENYEIMCNSPLEVYSTEYDDWFLGRIEYNKQYYFCCDDLDNPLLYNGMKVKIRI